MLAGVLLASLPAPVAFAAPPAAVTARAALVIVADAPASRQAVAGVGARLPEPWTLSGDAAVRKALAAAGQRASTGVALGNAAGRAALATKARKAASAAGVQAVLFVRVTPKRGGRLVTLLLVAPDDTDAALDTTVEVPASDDGAAVLDALRPALARIASPAPAQEVAPEAKPEKPAGDQAPSAPPPDKPASIPLGGADRAILIFSAGGGSGARVFRYHDGLSPAFRTLDLSASPDLVLAAEIYPLARLTIPVLRGLGIAGGFQHVLGVTSRTSTGTSVTTTWLRAEGGLRLRLPFGEGGRFVLGLHGGMVKERFGFQGDANLIAWLPDVNYLFWRLGADGRVRVGPVALLAGASYLPAIEGGALADRFRQTFFAAVELGGGLAVPLLPIFEMRASAVYTRVFYSFHPERGDVYVAGGALDHLVRAQVVATLML